MAAIRRDRGGIARSARRRRARVRRRAQRPGRHGAAVRAGRLASTRGTVADRGRAPRGEREGRREGRRSTRSSAPAPSSSGPGLGRSAKLQRTVTELLRATREPVVLDADALHLVDASSLLARQRAGAAPSCSPPTTASTRRCSARRRARTGSPPRAMRRRAPGARCCSRVRRRSSPRRAPVGVPALLAVTSGTPDLATPGTGRRARGDGRGPARAGRAGAPRRGARRTRPRARRRVARREVPRGVLARGGRLVPRRARRSRGRACPLRDGAALRGPRSISPHSRETPRPLPRRRTVGALRGREGRRLRPRRAHRGAALLDAGATSLAVALVDEGIELRDDGIEAPILLARRKSPSTALRDAIAARLTLAVGSLARRPRRRRGRRSAPSAARPREGRHRHAPQGVDPGGLDEVLDVLVRSGVPAGGAVDALPRRRRRRTTRTARSREPSSTRSSARSTRSARALGPSVVLHAANTAGALVGARVAARPRAASASGCTATCRTRAAAALVDGGPPRAAPGALAQGARRRGPRPARGRAPELRAPPRRSRWTPGSRRCRSATPTASRARCSTAVPRCSSAGARRPLAGVVTMDQLLVDCATTRSRSATRWSCSAARATRRSRPTSGRRARHDQLGGALRHQAARSPSCPSSDPGTIAPMGAATLEALAARGRDVHRVPAERDADHRRLRHGSARRAGCSSSARAPAARRTPASRSSGAPASCSTGSSPRSSA